MAKKPSKTERDAIYERIKEALEQTLSRVQSEKITGEVMAFRNRDFTIDGELRLHLGPRVNIDDLMIDLDNAFRQRIAKTWVSVGVRFPAREKEEKELKGLYEKFQGMYQIGTHSRRGTKKQFSFLGARAMVERLKEHGRRKPKEVYLRIYWQWEGKRPKRKE